MDAAKKTAVDPDASHAEAVVAPGQDGFRADRALSSLVPGMSRRTAKDLCHAGAVFLNGKLAKGNERVAEGDRFRFPDLAAPEHRVLRERTAAPRLTTHHGRQVGRLYEDDVLLVIAKPAEIPVHRGQDGFPKRETLEDVLLKAYPPRKPSAHRGDSDASEDDDTESVRPGRDDGRPFYFVHRLDQETTGVMLVAKTPAARDALIRDFEARRIEKAYWAVAVGSVPWDERTVKKAITYERVAEAPARKGGGRVPEWARRKMRGKGPRGVKKGVALEEGDPKGKACETHFAVEERFKGYTLLRCAPKTGRMHQIRVHLASEGFPLAYDPIYGRRSPIRLQEFKRPAVETEEGERVVLNRMPLHALKIGFNHPASGERMAVEAPLPSDLREFLRLLRRYRPL